MTYQVIKNKQLNIEKMEMNCDGKIAEDIPRPLSSHSATYLITGSPGSGKTNFMTNLLKKHKHKNKRCGLAKVYNHIIICSPDKSTIKGILLL